MTEPTTGELLKQLRSDLLRISEVVQTKFVPLEQNQIRWRPEPTKWSVGECLDHICLVDEQVLPVLTPAILAAPPLSAEQAEEPYKWGWLGKKFVEMVGPNAKFRGKAPKIFRPRPTQVSTGIVEDHLQLQQKVLALIDAADGRLLSAAKVPSPAVKLLKFRLGDYLAFIVAHEDRHIRQAVRVLNDPAFPKPSI